MKEKINELANAFYDEDYTFIEFVTRKRPTNQREAELIINNYLDKEVLRE